MQKTILYLTNDTDNRELNFCYYINKSICKKVRVRAQVIYFLISHKKFITIMIKQTVQEYQINSFERLKI